MRSHFTLTYTKSAGYAQADILQQMLAISRAPEKTTEQIEALSSLQESMPAVEQYRVTVSTVNGLQQAKYRQFWRDAVRYFTEQTGLPIPLPTVPDPKNKDKEIPIEIDELQDAILQTALSAAAALAATSTFETRTATPAAGKDGVTFSSDQEWIASALPGEIATVEGWIENCPASLQSAWAQKAYDANPGMWRQANDEAAKNFDAVSVN